jgi:hypothetical protein
MRKFAHIPTGTRKEYAIIYEHKELVVDSIRYKQWTKRGQPEPDEWDKIGTDDIPIMGLEVVGECVLERQQPTKEEKEAIEKAFNESFLTDEGDYKAPKIDI